MTIKSVLFFNLVFIFFISSIQGAEIHGIIMGDGITFSNYYNLNDYKMNAFDMYSVFRNGPYAGNSVTLLEDGMRINSAYNGLVLPHLMFYEFARQLRVYDDPLYGVVYSYENQRFPDKNLHTNMILGYSSFWQRNFQLQLSKNFGNFAFDMETKVQKRSDTLPIYSSNGELFSSEFLNAVKFNMQGKLLHIQFAGGGVYAHDMLNTDSGGADIRAHELIRRGFLLAAKTDKFVLKNSFMEYKVFSDSELIKTYVRNLYVTYIYKRNLRILYKWNEKISNKTVVSRHTTDYGLVLSKKDLEIKLLSEYTDYFKKLIFLPSANLTLPFYKKVKFNIYADQTRRYPTFLELNLGSGDTVGIAKRLNAKLSIKYLKSSLTVGIKNSYFTDYLLQINRDYRRYNLFFFKPFLKIILKTKNLNAIFNVNKLIASKKQEYFSKIEGTASVFFKLPVKQGIKFNVRGYSQTKNYDYDVKCDVVYTKQLFNSFINLGVLNLFDTNKRNEKFYFIRAYLPFIN